MTKKTDLGRALIKSRLTSKHSNRKDTWVKYN